MVDGIRNIPSPGFLVSTDTDLYFHAIPTFLRECWCGKESPDFIGTDESIRTKLQKLKITKLMVIFYLENIILEIEHRPPRFVFGLSW